MNDDGWIKLHRSLMEWRWYGDGNVKNVFLHLLLTATSKPTTQDGTRLERGQCIVRVRGLTKVLGLTRQQLRTAFNKLISTGEIEAKTVQGASGSTVVAVCNYDRYQGLSKSKGKVKSNPLKTSATDCGTNGCNNKKTASNPLATHSATHSATHCKTSATDCGTNGYCGDKNNEQPINQPINQPFGSRAREEELDRVNSSLDKNNKKVVINNSTNKLVSLSTTTTPAANFVVAVAGTEVEDLSEEKKIEAPLQVLNPSKRERENKQRERETAEAIGRLRGELFSSPLKCESAMRTAGILDDAELRTMAEDVFTEWQLVETRPEDVNLRHLLNQLRIKVREARKAARQPKTRQERIAESLRQIYAPAVGINKNDYGTDENDTQLPF